MVKPLPVVHLKRKAATVATFLNFALADRTGLTKILFYKMLSLSGAVCDTVVEYLQHQKIHFISSTIPIMPAINSPTNNILLKS